jgi:iron complex outermembrane receptor protein
MRKSQEPKMKNAMKAALVSSMFCMIMAVSCLKLSYAEELALSPEDLMFLDIPSVISASKSQQSISKSPSAIYVLNAEDIKESGATKIQEVLRMVPGMDYVFNDMPKYDTLTARGFYSLFSGRMMVLVNGRSVYTDYMGEISFEDVTNLVLEDIDRIEVIKGPGSALYGANAYCGVISIYTRSIAKSEGKRIDLTGGDKTIITNAIYAYTTLAGKFGVKAVARDGHVGDWGNKVNTYLNNDRGYVEAQYNLNSESNLWFSGGIYEGQSDSCDNIRTSYAQMKYNGKNIYAQVFYNYYSDTMMSTIKINPTTVLDGEVQHTLNWLKGNTLISGVNYRIVSAESNMLKDGKQEVATWAAFMQNQYQFSSKLDIYLGARYDHHPTVGDNLSPRVAGVYSFGEDHSMRISYGKAFKNPNLMNMYMDTTIGGAGSGGTTPPTGVVVPTDVVVPNVINIFGGASTEAEIMEAVELGYRVPLTQKIRFTTDLFRDRMYSLNDTSMKSAESYGTELGLEFALFRTIKTRLGYAYDYVKNLTSESKNTSYPEHKINTVLMNKFSNGIAASLMAYYVGESDSGVAYTLVNARVGYEFKKIKNMEIAMSVYNMFDNADIKTYSTNQDRKVTVTLSCKF